MKGLLLKDFYTVVKQSKIFLALLLIFSFIPSFSMMTFGICFCAMLPMTAMAYDEQSKWDNLAIMLPYSPRDIILSKYIVGYCCMGTFAIISSIVSIIIAVINGTSVFNSIYTMITMVCVSTILLSVSMPLMFKLGVEKGRMYFIFGTAVIIGVGVFLMNLDIKIAGLSENIFLVIFVIIAVILNLVSISLSKAAYRSKIG